MEDLIAKYGLTQKEEKELHEMMKLSYRPITIDRIERRHDGDLNVYYSSHGKQGIIYLTTHLFKYI